LSLATLTLQVRLRISIYPRKESGPTILILRRATDQTGFTWILVYKNQFYGDRSEEKAKEAG